MTETGAALAVADDDERGETEALAALHGLGHAIDVDELFDQLFAAILVARATIVAAATATIAATPAAVTTTATTAARSLAFGGGGGCLGGAFGVLNFVCHD